MLNEAINNDLKQLDTWLQGNKLSLNVAKTNSMFVSTKQKHNILRSRNEDLDLKIRDNELEIIKINTLVCRSTTLLTGRNTSRLSLPKFLELIAF